MQLLWFWRRMETRFKRATAVSNPARSRHEPADTLLMYYRVRPPAWLARVSQQAACLVNGLGPVSEAYARAAASPLGPRPGPLWARRGAP